eukprot:TRINITY_DN46_c0_g1_i2.p1 TRINITY_DN46_c0_g1~~TRINITY_DN46_c0_g1_i2.p1  ORF type:complete len:170 (-),score=26.24 TRINITY_DN46_c0_g1_i2:14-523(-)
MDRAGFNFEPPNFLLKDRPLPRFSHGFYPPMGHFPPIYEQDLVARNFQTFGQHSPQEVPPSPITPEKRPEVINLEDSKAPESSPSCKISDDQRTKKRRTRATVNPHCDPNDRSCKSCGTKTSKEWRRGPDGFSSLCNACGQRFAKIVRKEAKNKEADALHKIRIKSLLN